MPIEQAYYTSSEVGLRGTKGFQMNAASSGLDPATLGYLERQGGYAPPISFPTRPTDEELRTFPKTLAFNKLPNGYAVLLRSTYLGKDYTGRYGNFFTHFLVYPNATELVRLFSPVAAWEASFWARSAASETSLGTLDPRDVACTIDEERIRTVLSSSQRVDRVRDFAAAVHSALQTRRRIIIVDDDEAVSQWIAAAAVALPTPLVEQLTFTTYAKNPYNTDALICGTTADSDFGFSTTEVQHQFYVLDFKKSRFSPPAPASRFADALAGCYAKGDFARGRELGQLADRLHARWEAQDLDRIPDIRALVSNESLSREVLLDTATFIVKKGIATNQEVLKPLLAALHDLEPKDEALNAVARQVFALAFSDPSLGEQPKNDIMRFYLDHFVNAILLRGDRAAVEAEAKVFATHKVPRETWDVWVPEVRRVIETRADGAFIISIIELARLGGFLPDIEQSLGVIVTRTLTSSTPSAEAANLVADLYESDLFPGLQDVIFMHLHRAAGNGALLAKLSEYLRRAKFRERLRTMAKERDSQFLCFAVDAGDLSRSTRRAQDIVGIFERSGSEKWDALSEKEREAVLGLLLPDSVLSVQEALQLLSKAGAYMGKSPLFLRLAVQSILRAPDVTRSDKSRDTAELYGKLEDTLKTISKSVDPSDPSLRAASQGFTNCKTLSRVQKDLQDARTPAQREDLIRTALSLLPKDNASARSRLFDAYMQQSAREPEKTQDLGHVLASLSALGADETMGAVQRLLQATNVAASLTPASWTRLFQYVMSGRQASSGGGGADESFDKDLRAAYKRLSPAAKQIVDKALAADSACSKAWLAWQKNEGMVGWFKKHF